MDLPPTEVFRLAGAIVLLALGIWVFALAPRRRLQRAFLILMIVQALAVAAIPFTNDRALGERLFWYGAIAVPFAALNFALVCQRAHAQDAARTAPLWWRTARWATLAGCVVSEGAYVIDHAAFADGGLGNIAMAAGPLAWAATALVMARIHARFPPGKDSAAILLFVLAFAVHPAFLGTFYLVEGLSQGIAARIDWVVMGSLAVLLTAATIAVILTTARRSGDAALQRNARSMAILTAIAVATGGLPGILGQVPPPPEWSSLSFVALGSAWRLAFAGILAYAVLRYCPFGLSSRLRVYLREGTFVAIVGIVFFVVEQTLQQTLLERLHLPTELGIAAGLGVAAATAALLFPLHGACARLARRAVPPPEDAVAFRRRCLEIYRAAFVAATQDGIVTPKERSALRRLAESLGLAARDVRGIEEAAAAPTRPTGTPTPTG